MSGGHIPPDTFPFGTKKFFTGWGRSPPRQSFFKKEHTEKTKKIKKNLKKNTQKRLKELRKIKKIKLRKFSTNRGFSLAPSSFLFKRALVFL